MSYEFGFVPFHKEAIEVTLSINASGSGQTCSKWFKTTSQDFLHIGRLQQKETITVGISKILLLAANLHGHGLQVLLKMYTTDRKFYKDSLWKLTYFVVENFYNHFLFLFQLQVIIM